ncbi:hypothetical protein GCM10025867_14880 [Frondihabitans sucicola]|uniref:Uncharacterized protein n=1 Tax=Frondihabitans sucicola TaxID=1268041 RepID=A0ABN6XZI5_9MICO|nr:hypothetical protein [Frondihabitans sucicola]BDZ49247.1 hypothetical protein GCM10025867_14880 [Frondihabitans sucicola]
MAQVAILVNGTPDPRKTEISSALGILLGCPVLQPSKVQEALLRQTGPVAPAAGVRALAIETTWRTAGLIEAGVVLDAGWEASDSGAVRTGLESAGSPRLVEVWCGESGEPLGLSPVVRVDDVATVDMDALVQEISALFV